MGYLNAEAHRTYNKGVFLPVPSDWYAFSGGRFVLDIQQLTCGILLLRHIIIYLSCTHIIWKDGYSYLFWIIFKRRKYFIMTS